MITTMKNKRQTMLKNCMMKKILKRIMIFIMLVSIASPMFTKIDAVAETKKPFRVLAIGNSFSENAVTYLYEIAKSAGYNDIRIGNLYIAGCNLSTHWNNANKNTPAYVYNTNFDGSWKKKSGTAISTALAAEEWDYIILQQVSTHSGMADSFEPYLANLIKYVNENKTNPDAKLAWHMTWAYAKDSTHAGFVNYDKSQDKMYNAILDAVKTGVKDKYNDKIDIIIPSGTTIQNMRTSYIEDSAMTSDGYHLSVKLGCYAAGLTWLDALTGADISNISTKVITTDYLKIVKEATKAAISTPYAVTASTYKNSPADNFNKDNYDLLDWKPTAFSYWNATSTQNLYTATNVELNKRFIASQSKLSLQDMPVGSVILLSPGYQYRAEKWPESGLAATREPNTTDPIVEVTEAWWDEWKHVTFNLSKTDGTVISDDPDTHSAALKIYIPKTAPDKQSYTGTVNPPTLVSKTNNSIVVKAIEGYEFSLDGNSWQTSNQFLSLEAGKEHSIYSRVAETATTLASKTSDALKVTTDLDTDDSSSKSDSENPKNPNDALWYSAIAVIALVAVGFATYLILSKRKAK